MDYIVNPIDQGFLQSSCWVNDISYYENFTFFDNWHYCSRPYDQDGTYFIAGNIPNTYNNYNGAQRAF